MHDFLGQLVKAGKLKQFTHQPSSHWELIGPVYQREVGPHPPLETINVIFAAPSKDAGPSSKIMTISPQPGVEEEAESPRGL